MPITSYVAAPSALRITAHWVWILLAILSPHLGQATESREGYRVDQISVVIDQRSRIDWQESGGAENALIVDLITAAIADGFVSKEGNLSALDVQARVIEFDILSDFELFFCCAVNEIAIEISAVDSLSKQLIGSPTILTFDHVPASGVLAIFSDSCRGRL